MDGNGALNNNLETDISLRVARINRFATNAAPGSRLAWPEYEALRPYVGDNIPPHMSNFNLTSSCQLRAAMCCFVDDRVDHVVDANSVACRHDIADSKQSSNLNMGWGVYDPNTAAYCTAIAWGADGSTSEQYKGNALFDISFGTFLRKGYVKNIDGAPMCGCVEKMPVVSNTACREVSVGLEEYSLSVLANNTLNIVQKTGNIVYKDCAQSSFVAYYSTIASSTDQVDIMKTRIIESDCKSAKDTFLNDRFLITGDPGNQFTYPSPDIWQQVAGAGLSYYPITTYSPTDRDTEFRALVTNSPNKIIYRHCEVCNKQHQHIFYKRLTALPDYNFLELFLSNWVSTKNILGVDFDLYSTYDDALKGINKWLYCNYDDINIGFPRDCGRTEYTPCQWNSFKKGVCGGDYAPTSIGFYVEKPPSVKV